MTAGKRRTAREMAVQMLYQSDLGGSQLPSIFNTFDLSEYLVRQAGAGRKPRRTDGTPVVAEGEEPPETPETPELTDREPREFWSDPAEFLKHKRRVEEAFRYAQALVSGTVLNRERIDSLIRGQADNWRLERMPAVDRNILRLAIYEMLFERETPKLVVVDEAIELAKKFGSEQSGRFVNGLLDGLLKQHEFPGSLK